jgi:hypothetical protein
MADKIYAPRGAKEKMEVHQAPLGELCRVARRENIFDDLTVVHARVAHHVTAHEFLPAIDADMVLVSEIRDRGSDAPSRIGAAIKSALTLELRALFETGSRLGKEPCARFQSQPARTARALIKKEIACWKSRGNATPGADRLAIFPCSVGTLGEPQSPYERQ